MQPILDSFDDNKPSEQLWSGKIERQGVFIVITLVLFAINTLLIAILGQSDDPISMIIVVLIYIMGNIAVLFLGYCFFKLTINVLEQLLKLVRLDLLIRPFNLSFITFACFLNTIVCTLLLYWILSMP